MVNLKQPQRYHRNHLQAWKQSKNFNFDFLWRWFQICRDMKMRFDVHFRQVFPLDYTRGILEQALWISLVIYIHSMYKVWFFLLISIWKWIMIVTKNSGRVHVRARAKLSEWNWKSRCEKTLFFWRFFSSPCSRLCALNSMNKVLQLGLQSSVVNVAKYGSV